MTLNLDPLPIYAGFVTFLGAPRGDLGDLKPGMVAVAGVTYDESSTSRLGARFGPRSMRESSVASGSNYPGVAVREVTTNEVMEVGPDVGLVDLGDLNVYPTDWTRTEVALRRAAYEIVMRGAFPVFLGGDNFINSAMAQGYRDAVVAKGGRRIGYLQISRHLDLGTEDPIWGKVWRGSTARRIIDLGAMDPSNMAWVGPHGYVRAEEWAYARELDLSIFTLQDVRREGILSVTRQALEAAGEGCDGIYVSVDLDVVDGCYAAGTAAPNLDGIRDVELIDAMEVLRDPRVGAVGMVGINPTVEVVKQTTQQIASVAVMQIIAPRMGGLRAPQQTQGA